jgi:hypothetical protein
MTARVAGTPTRLICSNALLDVTLFSATTLTGATLRLRLVVPAGQGGIRVDWLVDGDWEAKRRRQMLPGRAGYQAALHLWIDLGGPSD